MFYKIFNSNKQGKIDGTYGSQLGDRISMALKYKNRENKTAYSILFYNCKVFSINESAYDYANAKASTIEVEFIPDTIRKY